MSGASITNLIIMGDRAFESNEINLAAEAYKRAIAQGIKEEKEEKEKKEENNIKMSHCYVRLGECCSSNGEILSAKGYFNKSIQAHETYQARMLLGQVTQAKESLENISRGISLMESELNSTFPQSTTPSSPSSPDQDVTSIPLRNLLCQAYCTLADLWMTDLCMEPDAESSAVSSVNSAITHSSSTLPDGLQSRANLRLSQNRGAEAADDMVEVWGRIREGVVAAAETVGMGEKDVQETASPNPITDSALEVSPSSLSAVSNLPGFEFRTQTAKLMLESSCSLLSSNPSSPNVRLLRDATVMVLGSLLSENDEVIETWFLLGVAMQQFGDEEHGELAKGYFGKAKAMLEKNKKDMECEMDEGGFDRDGIGEQIEDIEIQIEDIQDRLEELGGTDDGMEIG
mmetsp:Transcript_15143/g.31211  ORF Transcript_15143/g.31211 Transcript_15143/m.31211 type:complete len:401 (-) Transcript_15143:73-1275(-)